ncbi:MAG TPA: DUF58 domain-containing protein [Phycisphaerae bacterium]|nr:DUF58 domain-containing protein [Phycisphaerae bacterium]
MTRAHTAGSKSHYRYLDPDTLMRLGDLNLLARSAVEGFISGLHRSPHHGFSVEFSEHRPYTPGDELRHLDWVAYAKTDRYYVKQYEQETNLRCTILLDCSGSMNYSSGKGLTKLEYGSFLAATMAYLMVRQQDVVGLVAFDHEIRLHMPPGGSPAHFNEMCRRLEHLQTGQVTGMAKPFHDLAEMIKRRGLIIVISDLYDDESQVIRALRHFRHKRHGLILFHVFDAAELEFPFTKLTQFHDLETNERYQVDPRSVRDAYLAELRAFIDRYKKACSDSDSEYVLTDTSVPYAFLLRSYLARRQMMR